MFGQASARWPASTALVLMVAFFGVHLSSDLYLASPVTDMPGDPNNLAKHAKTEHPGHHSSVPSSEASKCIEGQKEAVTECVKKGAKDDFKEVTDNYCAAQFENFNCDALVLCQHCNKAGSDGMLKSYGALLDELVKGENCKKWASMAPKLPTSCSKGGQRSGGGSDSANTGLIIGIVVVVVLVVAVVIAVLVYCFMCAGDSKGHSAKPSGKSSKGSNSKKSGKSSKSRKSGKSSSKGGKSTKSAKSSKGGKSRKSSKK